MGLNTAMNTSLTGLRAAETQIDVVGNNVANANTIGFKASDVVFATQFLRTFSQGSGPTGNLGGSNPLQVGLGVKVADVRPDFAQGTLQLTSAPSDLAIEGDGFFIVEGSGGARFYTRAGQFQTNANKELVTTSGQRLLGFGINEDFEIQTGELTPLSIPLGLSAEAEATTFAALQGNLSPTGDVADTPEIIQSAILTDGTVEAPADLAAGDVTALASPSTAATAAVGLDATAPDLVGPPATAAAESNTAAGTLAPGNYFYRFNFVDASGNEGVPSATLNAAVTAGNDTLTLTNVPQPDAGTSYTGVRVFRSTTGAAGSFELAGPTIPTGTATFVDDGTQTVAGTFLDEGPFFTPSSPPSPTHFRYQITFVDSNGVESPPAEIPGDVAVGAGGKKIALNNLPAAPDATYTKRVYRSTAASGGEPQGPYVRVGGDLAFDATNFIDDGSSGAGLDETTLDVGNYTYYLTFYNSGTGLESRPTSAIGPQPINVPGRRVRLDNLPQPTGGGDFNQIRVYRSLSNNPSSIHLVDTLAAGTTTYIDAAADADISGADELNQGGPSVSFGLPLVDVLRRSDSGFEQVFEEGTLRFTGRKGGASVGQQEFEITAATSVQEFIDFVEGSLGIVTDSGDPANPIPGAPGGTLADGRFQFTANGGTANAIDIGSNAFELETTSGVRNVNLQFGSTQDAVGEGVFHELVVYDSLGVPINLRVTAALEEISGSTSTFRWYAQTGENDPVVGDETNVGTGLIRFDSDGNLLDVVGNTVSIQRANTPSSSPLQFDLDFGLMTGLSTPTSSLFAEADGSPAGVLNSYTIGEDGLVQGVFSNGVNRDLGQVRLARFANPEGLEQLGENLYRDGLNSGSPIEGDPGQNGIGAVQSGAIELSNTDIGANLVELILASTLYRSNTRVITTSQQMLDELLNLRR